MRLGGQVHDPIGLVFFERTLDSRRVDDVDLIKRVAIAGLDVFQRIQIASVSQFVDVDDLVIGFFDQQTNQVRANEPCSTSDNDFT